MTFRYISLLAVFTLALTACGSDSDSGTADISPVSNKAPLKSFQGQKTNYIPSDGDIETSSVYVSLSEKGKVLLRDNSVARSVFSRVDKLPSKYSVQPTSPAPYLKVLEFDIDRAGNSELDLEEYRTIESDFKTLIEHDIDDRVYSTSEFNEISEVTDNKDGAIGSTAKVTNRARLFSIETNNHVGDSINTITLRIVAREIITIPGGKWDTYKISYRSTLSKTMFGNPRASWKQKLEGTIWVHPESSKAVQNIANGTIIFNHQPNRTLDTHLEQRLLTSPDPDLNKGKLDISTHFPLTVPAIRVHKLNKQISEMMLNVIEK